MKNGKVYLFFDWSMTINELMPNNTLNQEYFNNFLATLKQLEIVTGCDVEFVVVSGTSKPSAEKRTRALAQAFSKANALKMFGGFAYEYGGYFMDASLNITRLYNHKTHLGKKIDKLCEKYGVKKQDEFELYYNFEFEKVDKHVEAFVAECKQTFASKDFEFYSDIYGIGLDIKNKTLNKDRFVRHYLKGKPAYITIVGGDSVQDLKMLKHNTVKLKYFVGFENSEIPTGENIVLSKKENILGVIDALKQIIKQLEKQLWGEIIILLHTYRA